MQTTPRSQVERRPSRERRELLAPLYRELGLDAAADEDFEPADHIRIGECVLALEPWQCELLDSLRRHSPARRETWWERVAQALIFRAICNDELARRTDGSEDGEPERSGSPVARLLTVAAVGIRVREELQAEMAGMIRDDRFSAARHLAVLEDEINEDLEGLRQKLGDEAFQSAESRAPEMGYVPLVEVDDDDGGEAEVTFGPERFQPRRTVRSSSVVAASGPRRRKRELPSRNLLLALAATLFLYALFWAFVLGPARGPSREMLTLARFDHIELILAVEARPPSLFLQVDAVEWEVLDVVDRTRIVEQASVVADSAGYNGILVRTDEGRPVAQWLLARGVRLFEHKPGS